MNNFLGFKISFASLKMNVKEFNNVLKYMYNLSTQLENYYKL